MKKQIMLRTAAYVAFCVVVAFAMAFMTACGETEDEGDDGGVRATTQDAQEPTTTTEATTAKNAEKKTYQGVVRDRFYDVFVLEVKTKDGEPELVECTTDNNTKYFFGNNQYMFVGDEVRVEYEDAGGVVTAKQIELVEEPEPGAVLGDYAASLCWPHGQMSKGRYDTGKPTDAYGSHYDRLKPERESSISSPQWRAGASCDLFVATALKGFGLTDFPVTLSDQCAYFFLTDDYKDAFEKIDTGGSSSNMKHGDIGIYIRAGSENNGQGHIFVVDKADGHNWKSNAHYRKDNGYYGVIDDLDEHYNPGKYKYFGVFRLKK